MLAAGIFTLPKAAKAADKNFSKTIALLCSFKAQPGNDPIFNNTFIYSNKPSTQRFGYVQSESDAASVHKMCDAWKVFTYPCEAVRRETAVDIFENYVFPPSG